MKKICIITNSKLGSFYKAYKYLNSKNYTFLIISTKKFKHIKNDNIKHVFISDKNTISFNEKVIEICKVNKINKILLFYTKKISKSIFNKFETINIHNSLLPNYKGSNAIKKTLRDKNKIFCSSAHLVNQKFDSGKILYQIATPISLLSKEHLDTIAYYQRVVLILTILENSKKNLKATLISRCTILSPGIKKDFIKKIKEIKRAL